MKPRGRSNIVAGIKPMDIYKLYHKQYKKTPLDCSYKRFKDILDETDIKAREAILNGSKVRFGHLLGDIGINKKKQYLQNKEGKICLPVDWKLSKQYGKKMYHLNKETREFIYFIDWQNKKVQLINKSVYDFKPCRTFARMLATKLKEGKDYIAQ